MNDISALVGARTDQGPFRSHNEDAYWVSNAQTPVELGAFYVVADGVGGQEHGAAAAQQAVQVVSESFYRLRHSGLEIPEALHDAILEANQAVYEQAQARGGGKMGCTLVAAVQHEAKLHVAHVGDARAYLLLNGRLRPLTRDDTWVQKQVDAGIITAEEAENHELRNIVTQVLGNKLDITVHLSSVQELQAGNIFLLCSDGLHGVLTNEQLYRLMKDNPPDAAASMLVDAAIKANTKDNVTAVVVNSGLGPMANNLVASPPQPSSGLRPPLWAIITLVTIVVLLLGWAVYGLLSSNNVGLDFGGGRETVEGGIELVATETAVPPQQPTTQLPTSAPPTETTLPPTDVLPPTTLPPTNTPLLQPTTSPLPPLRGCVDSQGILFVWEDAQIRTNTCDQTTSYSLNRNEEVLILDNVSVPVNGPDESCNLGNFIKIQSVGTPGIVGWAIQDDIRILPPGESCQ